MKARFDEEGFIHVTAQTPAEKFAMRWNREHLENADANGVVLHEDEPTEPTGRSFVSDEAKQYIEENFNRDAVSKRVDETKGKLKL